MNWKSAQEGQWMERVQNVLPYSTSSIPCMELSRTELYRWCILWREEKSMSKLFAALMNLNAMLDPHEVTIDLKIASIEALKSSFPNANIKGCFFHFAQANWQKNQTLGLAKKPRKHRRTNRSQIFRSSCTNPGRRHLSELEESTAKMQKEKTAEFELFWGCMVGRKKFARETNWGLHVASNLVSFWKRHQKAMMKLKCGYVPKKFGIRPSYNFQLYWYSAKRTELRREQTNQFSSWTGIPKMPIINRMP